LGDSLDLTNLMLRLPVVLLALTVHEFCHGYFAYRMGDPTAYIKGRLTLNPIKHLDPLGTICLLFAPIGWAKPVPIDVTNFRDRRKGILISTVAGPLSNIVQALVFALVLRGILFLEESVTGQAGSIGLFLAYAQMLCVFAVTINIGLAVFNLLPLFPLDGFHVVTQLLPPKLSKTFAGMAAFGPFGVLALVLIGTMADYPILYKLITPPVNLVLRYISGYELTLL
jgi:Zn-dependent protease